VNAAIVVAARHFPYQDGANHLARYVLLDRAWWGPGSAEVHVRAIPTPYIALDLVGAALVHVLGPQAALRAMVLLAVVLLPVGMHLLLGQTAPHRRGWALAGVLLGLSWYLLDGLLNFVIGAGLVFVWLAGWWPRRGHASLAGRLGMAAGAAGLFLVHLSAALSVLVVVWIDGALALLEWRRASPGARAPIRAYAPIRARALTAVTVTAAVFALWACIEWTLGLPQGGEGALVFRTPALKLAALGAPFYAFDIPQALVLAAGWLASLAAFLYVNRSALRVDAIVVSSLAFLLLFAISPTSVGSAGGVDVRWLLLAYLLPFCASERRPTPPQRSALAVVLLASVIHAGVVWHEVRRRDRLLADFDDVLSRVPRGARLLPIVADGRPGPRVGVYDEYAYWHVVRNGGRVPGLFNYNGTRPGDAPFTHFAHFEIRARRYVPPFRWGVRSFAPLDWDQIGRDYDYVIVAGADPRVTGQLDAHALVQQREGLITLYRVEPRP
jgi:hypothetical protein